MIHKMKSAGTAGKAEKLKTFFQSETVLVIAALAAGISMFFVPPSLDYINYIDFRTLSLLFCLMAAVSGLRSIGLFDTLAMSILPRFQNARVLSLVLVLLCFFSSMLITNDVALITFIPFTIIIFTASGFRDNLIYTVVLETAAANLGSMFTPVGNPQNLYLYSCYHINPVEFFRITLPVSVLGLLFLMAASLLCKNKPIQLQNDRKKRSLDRGRLFLYAALFLLSLFSVFYLIDYRLLVILVCLVLLAADRKLFRSIDYGLLLTFVCFFLFVGNVERIEYVHSLLSAAIHNREMLSGVLLSQVISNVPAAVLLSGFTDHYKALILGTNIGGLGTLVASLASLISFKFYVRTEQAKPLRYLGVFTAVNLAFLLPMLLLSYLFYI